MLLIISGWLLVLLAACTDSPSAVDPQPTKPPVGTPGTPPAQPNPASEPAEPPDSVAEIPFDYTAMETDVLIRHAAEPRLHAPIQTVVTPAPQTYHFFFRQPMDRRSVEETIQYRAEERARQNEGGYHVVPAFAFAWASDQQLHLTVTLPPVHEPEIGSRRYLLDVTGAFTRAGKRLEEQPSFQAVLYSPSQLWRISTDGSKKEPLTRFTEPYHTFRLLGEDGRYLMLSRFREYCECDAGYEQMYAIYDRQEKRLVPYPFPLKTEYRGPGRFYADKRGFFYAAPEGAKLPEPEHAVAVRLSPYVHGASFSRDRQYLLLAVGREQQTGDFDLVIRHLETGREQRIPRALGGQAPENVLTGGPMPVQFHDDGVSVYFAMQHPSEFRELRYRYTWKEQRVTAWQPSIPPDAWSGFTASDDGLYQLYPNGGLFRGEQSIDPQLSFGHWLPGTHQFVYTALDEQAPDSSRYREQILLYDADRRTTRTIVKALYLDTQIVGISPDGKWIYVQTAADLSRVP